MANVSFSADLVNFLRRVPPLYAFLRSTRSVLSWLVTEALRFSTSAFVRFGPPAGIFGLIDDLRKNRIEGRILVEAQQVPPPESGSVSERTGWDLQAFYPWPIFWARVPAARLVGPSLALMREDKHIALESLWNEHCYRDDPSFTCLVLPAATKLKGAWTSIVGRYCGGYFHWLMDALPRLACLSEFPPDTRILAPANLRPYERESLQLLGLIDRVRQTPEKHLQLESYYFSSPTAMTGVSNPYAVNFLRERLLPRAAVLSSSKPRVFVWREGKTRGIRNQSELANFLRLRNWMVTDLEELSFQEQIGLFRQATAICAAHGAAMTNLIWCSPGTKVLEIFPDRFLNGCYETIARLVNLDHRYLILPGDSSFRITVPIRSIEEHLDWLNEDRTANNR
jgi:hypothetical protein